MEIVVPDTSAHARRIETRVSSLIVLAGTWVVFIGAALSLALLAGWAASVTAAIVLGINVVIGAPAVVFVASLMAVAPRARFPVRLRHSTVDVDRVQVSWESVTHVTCTDDRVELRLRNGDAHLVARDLSAPAARWLARVLVEHHWRTLTTPFDAEGHRALEGLRHSQRDPARRGAMAEVRRSV